MKVKLIIEISGVMEDYEGEALDWIGDEIEKYCDPISLSNYKGKWVVLFSHPR